uniref:GST_C_6 domain-containing protein n=1 Tax=Haemonchus contortus TaxID=6289 RepID=A0A7I4XX95_HAECO
MDLSPAHFDARHAHCGWGFAKLMCALYFSGYGPPIPRLTRSLQADLKELRNFVTDIQTVRQTYRQTDRQTDSRVYICVYIYIYIYIYTYIYSTVQKEITLNLFCHNSS